MQVHELLQMELWWSLVIITFVCSRLGINLVDNTLSLIIIIAEFQQHGYYYRATSKRNTLLIVFIAEQLCVYFIHVKLVRYAYYPLTVYYL